MARVQVTGWVRRLLQQPGTVSLTRYLAILPEIAGREQRLRELTDDELTGVAGGAGDDVEICALGREAARRGLGERSHDVQLLGTLAMLSGRVAEMATGEGKTMAGAIAAAGFALRGRSVHVMSVNDYLARRDAEWMRPVYDLLGVTVGWIGQKSTPRERRDAYAAQVTYASVSEFGFDLLRDRLCTDAVRAFTGMLRDVEERSAKTFRTARIDADGIDLDAAGLKRPTATWTYLVHDSPFRTDLGAAIRGIGRLIHKATTS